MIRSSPARRRKAGSAPGSPKRGKTLDLLAEEGLQYVSDWVNDDQPYEIKTA